MNVLHDLLQALKPKDTPITQVLMGVNWTMVQSRVCGLASTQKEPPPHYNKQIRDVGSLHTKSSFELAEYVLSENWLEATLGLAAINSMIEFSEQDCTNENAFYTLQRRGQGKKVAIIGHFPFVSKLKPLVGELYVFELNPREGDFHADQAEKILPQCDVIGISATTLINHTFDQVIGQCRPEAFKVMIGPSTPMHPVLFDYGIDVLAGSKITDPDRIYHDIAQGANFRQLNGVKIFTMAKR